MKISYKYERNTLSVEIKNTSDIDIWVDLTSQVSMFIKNPETLKVFSYDKVNMPLTMIYCNELYKLDFLRVNATNPLGNYIEKPFKSYKMIAFLVKAKSALTIEIINKLISHN